MVKHTFTELSKKISKMPDDFRFAAAYALTQTAKEVQKSVREEMAEKMELKNTWTSRGIRIEPATKQKLESQVYSLDWYVPQQEEGATRTAQGGEFWIPGDGFQRVTGLDPKKKVIPVSLRKGKIMERRLGPGKNRPFMTKTRSGKRILAVRTTEERKPIEVLYFISEKPSKIKGLKFFFEPSQKTYDKVIEQKYNEGVQKYVL